MDSEEFKKFLNCTTEQEFVYYAENYRNNIYTFESPKHEISFLYNLGLFFSEIYQTGNWLEMIFRKEDKYYYPIYFYLKAVHIYEKDYSLQQDWLLTHETMKRCYTNLGKELSDQFRTFDAMIYFRKALKIDPFFDMAIGNYALCIEKHYPFLDFNSPNKIFNLLYSLYDEIHLDKLENGKDFFKDKKQQYNSLWIKNLENKRKTTQWIFDLKDEFNCIDDDRDSYSNWCVENVLYLNSINDINSFQEATFDVSLKYLDDNLQLGPDLNTMLKNMMKLYFNQRKKLYINRNNETETSTIELMLIFNCLYSFFDKVAFWIYRFFSLDCEEHKVNFNSVWNQKTKDGIELLDIKNQYLYGIYWIRKEYRENRQDKLKINPILSPDSQLYSDLRNHIEHKDYCFNQVDNLYYISPKLLYSKTIKLMNIIRNLILSLILMVRIENKLTDSITQVRNYDLIYFEYEGFK